MDLITLGCIAFGWVSALSGVALGGYLVFKTKREPYENLWAGSPKGEAVNLSDGLLDEVESMTKDMKVGPLGVITKQNEALRRELEEQ